MQQGGVVMDVTNANEAVIAETAGAVAVMALERVPADIRAQGGVARMADPKKIEEPPTGATVFSLKGQPSPGSYANLLYHVV